MSLISKNSLRTVLFTFVFGASAAIANAQFASFDLPFQAHWGGAVLEPGHYKISAPMSTVWPQVLYLLGPDKAVYTVIAATQGPEPAAGHSYLRVLNYGDQHYVRDFAWSERGKYFTFPKPKSRQLNMAQRSKPEESVVSVAALARK